MLNILNSHLKYSQQPYFSFVKNIILSSIKSKYFMMHKSPKIIIVIISLFFISTSCNKFDNLVTFYVDDQTTTTIKSSSPVSLPIELPTPDITTNSENEFKKNNTNVDLVKDIYITQLKLTITSPENKTFSFLKSIHIYISTNENNEIELAYKEDVNSNSQSIDLDLTKEKLDIYVKADSYKLRTKATTRETLTQDVDIQIDLQFKVTAKTL